MIMCLVASRRHRCGNHLNCSLLLWHDIKVAHMRSIIHMRVATLGMGFVPPMLFPSGVRSGIYTRLKIQSAKSLAGCDSTSKLNNQFAGRIDCLARLFIPTTIETWSEKRHLAFCFVTWGVKNPLTISQHHLLVSAHIYHQKTLVEMSLI